MGALKRYTRACAGLLLPSRFSIKNGLRSNSAHSLKRMDAQQLRCTSIFIERTLLVCNSKLASASFREMGSLQKLCTIGISFFYTQEMVHPTAHERHAQQGKEREDTHPRSRAFAMGNPSVETLSLGEPGSRSPTISLLTMAVEYQA